MILHFAPFYQATRSSRPPGKRGRSGNKAAGDERLSAVRTFDLRFDVNCSILFTERPLLERPAAARAAGFDAVEFWWPFAATGAAGS